MGRQNIEKPFCVKCGNMRDFTYLYMEKGNPVNPDETIKTDCNVCKYTFYCTPLDKTEDPCADIRKAKDEYEVSRIISAKWLPDLTNSMTLFGYKPKEIEVCLKELIIPDLLHSVEDHWKKLTKGS